MIRLFETLDSKNELYHSTSIKNLKSILESGFIQPSMYREFSYQIKNRISGNRSISLTRNLAFAKAWDECVIVIDKNLLKNSYKIFTYSAFQKRSKLERNEYEEFVIKPIPLKYFKKILISKSINSQEIKTDIQIEFY